MRLEARTVGRHPAGDNRGMVEAVLGLLGKENWATDRALCLHREQSRTDNYFFLLDAMPFV